MASVSSSPEGTGELGGKSTTSSPMPHARELQRRAATPQLVQKAAERYQRVLRAFLNGDGEEALESAYELSRWALESGIGLLDLAGMHQKALAQLARETAEPGRAALQAGTLLLEALSPFESAHRGYQEANEVLRYLNDRMEEEAKRIASSLHAEAGQLLTAVHIALDELELELPPETRARAQKIRGMLDGVELQLRQLSHELRPALLDDLGVEPAIRFHAEGVAKRSHLRVLISGSTEGRLPPQIETVLYRVVQEALTNVVRHAQATQASVLLRRDPDGIRCFVADNGKGYVPQTTPRKTERGMGLHGLRDRLGLLGGTLELQSAGHGEGTVLLAWVPLAK